MDSAPAQARLQQRVEELCAAAVRALSGQRDLHFRGHRLHRGRRALPLYAPHLHPSLERDDFGSFRGAADGLALRLVRSDDALHARLCPAAPVERLVFEMLEQFRAEALPPPGWPGVARNLRHRFEAWLRAFHASGLTETARGLLLFTVAQVARARVTGEPVLEETEDLMEATRAELVPVIGHDLAGLRRARGNQAAYAPHALAIARLVGELLRAAEADAGDAAAEVPDDEDDDERAAFKLLMPVQAPPTDGDGDAPVGGARALADTEARDDYRVFTRAYDREVEAATLVRASELQASRERLDRRVAAEGINLPRLARELQALLAEPARDGWDGGLEEGRIDGRRLAQLITSPAERRLFRAERIAPVADCVVGLLVDCSGSMRAHAEAVAALADVLARALELAGVESEVLGFTTGAWHGGRAQRDWQRAGKPAKPGRLNEACHLVFKPAEMPWRRARPAMAALLKDELFREGIDGEAVDWACARLLARPQARRLLLVVSDGCPMDGATNLANDPDYLDRHLREVVARREQAGEVAIFGVGVGLDLSASYARSRVLDLARGGVGGALRDIVALLRRAPRV